MHNVRDVRARGHSELASCTHLVLTRLCMFTPPPPTNPYTPARFQVYDAIHYYNIAREAADSEFSYQFEILRLVNLLRAQAPPFALQLSVNPTPFYPVPAAAPPAAAAVVAAAAPPTAAAVAAADMDTEEESTEEEESESSATSVNSLLAE